MRNEIILVRHGDSPPDDRVHIFAHRWGFKIIEKFPFRGDTLEHPTEMTAGTVVFGGKYNVFEENKYPFLIDENDWIVECMKLGLPVLALCQGAQQIARILGAHVGPKPTGIQEFGYYEIRPTEQGREFLPEPKYFSQAHYHTFDIPNGAVHLAESDKFENQAFCYKENVYGLQFHPECTIEGFRRWQETATERERHGAQTIDEQRRLMAEHDETQAIWCYDFLGKLFKPAE